LESPKGIDKALFF